MLWQPEPLLIPKSANRIGRRQAGTTTLAHGVPGAPVAVWCAFCDRRLRVVWVGARLFRRRTLAAARAWVRDRMRRVRWHVWHGLPLRAFGLFGFARPERYCPVCERSSRHFVDDWPGPRQDARCQYCFAAERERLVWRFLEQTPRLFPPRPRVLHIGPGDLPSVVSRMKARFGGRGYITAGLELRQVVVKTDVTSMAFADEVFDLVYCSHVLEHVEQDRKALREIRRVLRVGGHAIFQVPIVAAKTLEDPTVVDPEERLAAFGATDHVRGYGADFAARLRTEDFSVETFQVDDVVKEEAEVSRLGLALAVQRATTTGLPKEALFVCRR